MAEKDITNKWQGMDIVMEGPGRYSHGLYRYELRGRDPEFRCSSGDNPEVTIGTADKVEDVLQLLPAVMDWIDLRLIDNEMLGS